MTSRQTGVKAGILAHLANQPGYIFTTGELMRQLGIVHAGTVNSSLIRLREEGHPIEQPTKGSWTYRGIPAPPAAAPAAPAAPAASELLSVELLQIIARVGDTVIVRDEDSKIWVLKILLQEGKAA